MWAVNHSTFLDIIPRELQETQQSLSLDNEIGVKMLGLEWNPTNDKLQVKNNTTQVQSIVSTTCIK